MLPGLWFFALYSVYTIIVYHKLHWALGGVRMAADAGLRRRKVERTTT